MFAQLMTGLPEKKEIIAVVGLGYVGLPLAVRLATKFNVVGFDVNSAKVENLRRGVDETGEVSGDDLDKAGLDLTDDASRLSQSRFIIVCVPTPIDSARRPDLKPLLSASALIGKNIRPGTIVVYESTVYPGVTEDECVPVIERESGLKCGADFRVGYSPERINPGDREHTVEKIIKVVSGQDAQTLETVAGVYGAVIDAGVHRASSIKVAEAAKVIENSQRDLNIAFMNELAMIFHLMGIDTKSVLEAAGTKWNFLKFTPGLVGGHCIGVDPYYLTSKAEELGYLPQVILSGRRINDGMGKYIAEQTIKQMIKAGKSVLGARVCVLGMTFKENVPDIRNSRVPDIIKELLEYGVEIISHDPLANADEVREEYGIELSGDAELANMDCVILAVAHRQYLKLGTEYIRSILSGGAGIVVDVKSIYSQNDFGDGVTLWRL